jgi:hypothetical protein
MKRMPSTLLAVCLLAVLFLSACKREEEDPQAVIDAAFDNGASENEFSAIFKFLDEEHRGTSDKTTSTDSILPACATTTFTQLSANPVSWRIVVDFGSTGCLCQDGAIRRGKLIGVTAGEWHAVNSSITITGENYQVNTIKLMQGQKVITYQGNDTYQVVVTNAVFNYNDTATSTWNCNRTTRIIQGQGTLTPWDDVSTTTGSANGITRRGDNYTVNVDNGNPLIYDMNCLFTGQSRHFKRGKLSISSQGNTLAVDYDPTGLQPCDKQVAVKWNDLGPFDVFLQ